MSISVNFVVFTSTVLADEADVLTLSPGVKERNGFALSVLTRKRLKWEHILQYKRLGVYRTGDGRTVADYLLSSS